MVPMLPSEVGQVDGTFKLTFAAFHFCVTGTVSVHTKDAKAEIGQLRFLFSMDSTSMRDSSNFRSTSSLGVPKRASC